MLSLRTLHLTGHVSSQYLYNMRTGEYSFLEVNPRLQVEHPVTEAITGVNIPAVQLQIAMGVALGRIDDVRAFFGLPVGGGADDERCGEEIDFDALTPLPPKCHCVAARITAENPEDGFKPTSGAISELSFRGVPGVTAYFSVGPTASGVHQFADSQFGHVFASAPTRDAAIVLLVSALADLSVRGEIHTNTKYLQALLEKPQFVSDVHDTAWLDGLIAAHDRAARVEPHVAVVCGAVMVADDRHCAMQAAVLACLERGVAPEQSACNFSEHAFELIYEGAKYRLRVTMGEARSDLHSTLTFAPLPPLMSPNSLRPLPPPTADAALHLAQRRHGGDGGDEAARRRADGSAGRAHAPGVPPAREAGFSRPRRRLAVRFPRRHRPDAHGCPLDGQAAAVLGPVGGLCRGGAALRGG